MAYRRRDPESRCVINCPKASGAIVEGQLMKKNGTSNNVTAFTADAVIFGIATEAAATGAAYIKVDMLRPGEWITGDVGTGTPASGDFKCCDAQAASPSLLVDVAATTNNDFFYTFNGTTTTVDLLPKKLECTADIA